MMRLISLLALSLTAILAPPLQAAVPDAPSVATIQGRQLLVSKRLPDGTLASPLPYIIRGVVWAPASEDINTSPTDPNNAAVRRPEFCDWYETDIPLLKAMNVNTVRMLIDPGVGPTDAPCGMQILDEFYRNDIMVIMNVDDGVNDEARVTDAVGLYKDHPAILMWMLGSEWNINLYFDTANSVPEAAERTESAAALIKTLDVNHPVATSYGEIDVDTDGMRLGDTQSYVNDVAPSVDVWALNIFRGPDFHGLFYQWEAITSKPMFLGELGTDAFGTACATEAPIPGAVAERIQAQWDTSLWNDILDNLSANDASKVALGGTFYAFNDEWWKVAPAGSQQTGGFVLVGAHPDDFSNEEYLGVVDIQRSPREAYDALQRIFDPAYAPEPNFAPFDYRVDFSNQPNLVETNIPTYWVSGSSEPGSQVTINGAAISTDDAGNFGAPVPLGVGDNAVDLVITSPQQGASTVSKTVRYNPGLSTENRRLLYVAVVTSDGAHTGTVVIDVDGHLFLGLLQGPSSASSDALLVRGISPDAGELYMFNKARVGTATHQELDSPSSPLAFDSFLGSAGFLVAPDGNPLYNANQVLDVASNTVSPETLPVSILTGNSYMGAPVPGGPAVSADGGILFSGRSRTDLIDTVNFDNSRLDITLPGSPAFRSDLGISPDGNLLVEVGYQFANGHARFYDASTLDHLGTTAVGDFSGEMVFSSDGQKAIAGSAGNPVKRGGGVTVIDVRTLQKEACRLIDLADNVAISNRDEIFVSSGNGLGIDAFRLKFDGMLVRTKRYFLGVNRFVKKGSGGPVIPANDEIDRIVFKPLVPEPDSDTDGVPDFKDNCSLEENGPMARDAGGNVQLDTDDDGFGNICDPDFNNNGVVDAEDFSMLKSRFGQPGFPDQDLNGNGTVDAFDFSQLKSFFGKPPGPSGQVP